MLISEHHRHATKLLFYAVSLEGVVINSSDGELSDGVADGVGYVVLQTKTSKPSSPEDRSRSEMRTPLTSLSRRRSMPVILFAGCAAVQWELYHCRSDFSQRSDALKQQDLRF